MLGLKEKSPPQTQQEPVTPILDAPTIPRADLLINGECHEILATEGLLIALQILCTKNKN
jgi:hypothetical protein